MAQPTTSQLIADLFGNPGRPLAGWYAELLDAVPPLRSFTLDHRLKIRKKVRTAADAASRRDLRCELAVAALLTADRRSRVIYEPLNPTNRRGPDFLLQHKGHTSIYVEVSRMRPSPGAERDRSERLESVLCGKLNQMAAGSANLLALVNDAAPADTDAMTIAVQHLKRRAEAKDDAYFAFRGLAGARVFLQHLPSLTGIFLATPMDGVQELLLLPSARRPFPDDLARAFAAWNLVALLQP